jgi:hypothetical protein
MATLAMAKPPSGAAPRLSIIQAPTPTPQGPPPAAAAEVARHLPSAQAYGTFLNGRRIATPSGETVQARRPASALVCSNRGISVGATVRRGDELPVTTPHPPPLSVATCEQFILEAADVLGKDIPAACQPSGIGPQRSVGTVAKNNQWRDAWLSSQAALVSFPFVMAGVPNPRRLEMVLRAATLISALLRFKTIVESGVAFGPAQKTLFPANETSANLFNQNITIDTTGRRAVANRDNSRHIIVSCGGHHFVVEVQEPQGRWLTSHEIATRLELVVETAARRPRPFGVFSKLCWLAPDDLHGIAKSLRATCTANTVGLAALSDAIFSVTLLDAGALLFSDETADDNVPSVGHLSASSGSWLGSSLQLYVDRHGAAVVQGHAVLVAPQVLFACANHIQHLSKDDALRPYTAPISATATGVVRPFLPPKPVDPKEVKKAPPVQAVHVHRADEDLPKCFEAVCPVHVQSEPCRQPYAVDLWLPVVRLQAVSSFRLAAPAWSKSFALRLSPANEAAMLFGVIAAFSTYLRPGAAVWFASCEAGTQPELWLVNSRTLAIAQLGIDVSTAEGSPSRHSRRFAVRRRCDAAVADLHSRFVAADANPGPPFVSALRSSAASSSGLIRWAVGDGGCCSQPDLVISRVSGKYPNLSWEIPTTRAEFAAKVSMSYTVLEDAMVCTFSSFADSNSEVCAAVDAAKSVIVSFCEGHQ